MGLKKVDGAPLGALRLDESLDASRGCGDFHGLMQYLGLSIITIIKLDSYRKLWVKIRAIQPKRNPLTSPSILTVIPAEAGICFGIDSRLRGNDIQGVFFGDANGLQNF